MNFNFGAPNKTTGGLTLPTTTATPVNTGLTFAAGDNKTLGTQQTAPKTAAFGLPFAAVPSSTTNFQLGTATSTAAVPTLNFGATQLPNVSFNLPMPATTGTPAMSGFSLGSALAQTSTFSLPTGGTAIASKAPTLTLGTPASSAPSFNLGAAPASSAPSFNLGGTPASSAPSYNLGTAPASSAPSFNLGAAPVSSAPSFNLGTAPTTTTAAGFTLGGISSSGLTLGTPAATGTTATSFTLGKVSATPATATLGLSLSTTAATTALPSTTAQSIITTTPAGAFTFAQLEEALNKWTLELEDQGKMFINQALQLNAWDRLVIANGEKILTLNNGIEKVKQQQQQLDHELDFVLAQQRELEECILPLEKELKDVPITDQDRNHTYQMAENMDTQLKQMSEDLKEIIEHLNESNKTEDTNDPVAQIGRILNANINSLQWIDRNTAQISTYLDQITKMHDMHRRDNERSFHLTYE